MVFGVEVAGLSSSETLLVIIVGILTVIFPIWAIVDIIKRPEWAWQASGRNRFTWLILMIVGIFICNVSFLTAAFYLLFVRPDVRNQQQVGRGPGFPTYP